MYNVSSAYQAAAADPLAAWSRQLLIGTSDHAPRVTAWPTVSRTWNNINPSTVVINLSNDDGALNMLMTNPSLLNSSCKLNIGFSSKNLLPSAENWLSASWVTWRGICSSVAGGFKLTSTSSVANLNNVPPNVGGSNLAGRTFNLRATIWTDSSQVNSETANLTIGDNTIWSDMGNTYITAMPTIPTEYRLSHTFSSGYVGSCGVGFIIQINANSGYYIYGNFAMAEESAAYDPYNSMLAPGEYLTTFAGTIQSVQYNNGVSRGGAGEGSTAAGNGSAIAELTLIDKFINLATRVCGDATTPINYTGSNYTVQDMAWYICTSYGGLSAITSTSNPDIDYASFGSWSSVFSADSTKMQASFSGQKPVELLQKISNLTQSAIGIENNKVKFARFNLTSSATSVFDESSVIDTLVTLDMTGLINKMSVGALYNVSSQSYGITVTAIDTPSVNSYGIHQDNSMETNIWLVDSVSANNLVQRTLFSGKTILPSFQMTTPLQAIASTIGDILLYSDAQLGISSQAYRCMAEDLDLDGGTKTYYMNQTMLANVFRLDYSSLDSSDVLT